MTTCTPSVLRRATARSARIDRFILSFIAGGRAGLCQPYHYKSFRTGKDWVSSQIFGLDREAIAQHLEGRIIVAPMAPRRLAFVDYDIDAKEPATRATVYERLEAVLAACNRGRRTDRPAGIIWASSMEFDGGLRLRRFLTSEHDADELYDRAITQLATAGLSPRSGQIEVWPCRGRSSRAPLGRGSALCDDRGRLLRRPNGDSRGPWVGLSYVPRTVGRGELIRRNVDEMLSVWEQRRSERTVSLEEAFGGARTISLPGACIPQEKKGKPSLAGGSAAYGRSEWQQRVAGILAHGAPRGERFDSASVLLYELGVRRRLRPADALAAFCRWLDTAPHTSRDLNGPMAGRVRARMVRDARRYFDKNFRRTRPGDTEESSLPSTGSYAAPLLSTRAAWAHVGERSLGRASRAALDASRFVGVDDVRLRRALTVLAHLLRKLRVAFPDARAVAAPSKVLGTIAGGRPFASYPGRTAYVVLVEVAQASGLLGERVVCGTRDSRSASLFTLL